MIGFNKTILYEVCRTTAHLFVHSNQCTVIMKEVFYLCIALCLFTMPLCAESSKCEKCVTELEDSNVVCKIGYGHSTNRKIAKEQAKSKARDALLEVLRDSVAEICRHVEVQSDAEGEYLSIKYFSEEEECTKYYFHEDGFLNHIKTRCREWVRKKDGVYEASCVLSAPKEEFSRASNFVMFQILNIMADYFHQE